MTNKNKSRIWTRRAEGRVNGGVWFTPCDVSPAEGGEFICYQESGGRFNLWHDSPAQLLCVDDPRNPDGFEYVSQLERFADSDYAKKLVIGHLELHARRLAAGDADEIAKIYKHYQQFTAHELAELLINDKIPPAHIATIQDVHGDKLENGESAQ